MDDNNKKLRSNLVENINYELSYAVIKKETKCSLNSVFLSLICKLLKLIGKLLKCIIFSIREIFICSDDEKASSETIEISNIKDLNINQIKCYLHNYYYGKLNKLQEIERDKLLNDLVVFKAYKEDLEINIKNDSLIKDIFTLFISILGIYVSMPSILQEIDANSIEKANNEETKILIGFATLFIILFSVIWVIIRTDKKSDSSRLKVVNYGVHTLEAIKEEMDIKKWH